jgi:hypothetical protein
MDDQIARDGKRIFDRTHDLGETVDCNCPFS